MQLFGQMNPGKKVPSFPTLLSSMVNNEGISSIYKGVDAAIGLGAAGLHHHDAVHNEEDVGREEAEGRGDAFEIPHDCYCLLTRSVIKMRRGGMGTEVGE